MDIRIVNKAGMAQTAVGAGRDDPNHEPFLNPYDKDLKAHRGAANILKLSKVGQVLASGLAAAVDMFDSAWTGFTKWIRISMWIFLIAILATAGFLAYTFISSDTNVNNT